MEIESPDNLLAKFEAAAPVEGAAPQTAPVVPEQPESPTPSAEAPVEPTPEVPATPTAEQEPVPGEQPTPESPETPAEPTAATPASPEDPEEASGRFRLKGKAAAFAQLVREGMPEHEAVERIYGKVESAPAEPTPVAEDPVAKLESELSEVKAKLKEAASEGVVYNDELDALSERRSELLLEIRDAKAAKANAEKQQQSEADAQFESEWQNETAKLIEMYGDSAKDDGALSKAFLEEGDRAAADPKHRFHRLWATGTFTPLVVGPILAAELNISRATKAAPTTPAPAPVAQPSSPRVLPVSGGARTTPTPPNNPAVAEAQRRERLTKATSVDEMMSVFAEVNTPGGLPQGHGFRMA